MKKASSDVPRFLALGMSPEKRYPLRAKVRRNGALYERRDGGMLDPGDGHSVLWPEVVIDADTDGAPRRPRLLCNEHSHRVAVHRDAADLAPVALAGAFVVPTEQRPAALTELTPGVHLEAGAMVKPLSEARKGVRQIFYDGLFLEVTGYVKAAHVDVVFEPTPLKDDGVRDGEIIRDVELKDSPSGVVVARVGKDPSVTNRLYIKTLSPPRAGQVLIRYVDHAAHAVGWVPTASLKRFPQKKLDGGGGGGGFGMGVGPKIRLTKGSLLRSDASGAVLGIVTRNGEFLCEADCESKQPLVRASACGGDVQLRATRE